MVKKLYLLNQILINLKLSFLIVLNCLMRLQFLEVRERMILLLLKIKKVLIVLKLLRNCMKNIGKEIKCQYNCQFFDNAGGKK